MGEEFSDITEIRREYDWETTNPVVAIADLIAEIEGGEETEPAAVLDEPLYTYIETDALSALARSDSTVSITLQFSGYHVQFHENTLGVTRLEE